MGIPLQPKEAPGKQDAAASEISWQQGVAFMGAFFWPPGQTAKGSQWEILPLLKSLSRDRTSSWAARLNQNHKLLGSVRGELGEMLWSANTGGKT